MLLLFPALAGLRTEWQEAASLLGAGRLATGGILACRCCGRPCWHPDHPDCQCDGAYATVYALVNTSYNLMTIRIANLVSGDLFLQPNLASALALILVLLLAMVTLIQQWLLRRSYHVAER